MPAVETRRRPFTGRGVSVLVVATCVLLVAWLTNQREAYWLAVALFALPLLAYLWTRLPIGRLQLKRRCEPRQASVAEPVLVVLDLSTKRLGLPILTSLEEQLPAALGVNPRFALSVPAGGSWQQALSYQLTPTRRGRYEVGPLLAGLSDPFGLSRRIATIQSISPLVVYPRIFELPEIRSVNAGQQVDESLLRSGALGQDDVLLRDYRMGDDVRRVHWRSTAKFGELMVRREEQADQPRARVILDDRASRHRGEGADGSLELAISAAASIAISLRAGGQRVIVDDVSGQLYDSHRHQLSHADADGDPLLERMVDIELTEAEQLLTDAAGRIRFERTVLVLGAVHQSDLQEIAGELSPGLAVLICSAYPSVEAAAAAADEVRQLGWRVLEMQDGTDLISEARSRVAGAGRRS